MRYADIATIIDEIQWTAKILMSSTKSLMKSKLIEKYEQLFGLSINRKKCCLFQQRVCMFVFLIAVLFYIQKNISSTMIMRWQLSDDGNYLKKKQLKRNTILENTQYHLPLKKFCPSAIANNCTYQLLFLVKKNTLR